MMQENEMVLFVCSYRYFVIVMQLDQTVYNNLFDETKKSRANGTNYIVSFVYIIRWHSYKCILSKF